MSAEFMNIEEDRYSKRKSKEKMVEEFFKENYSRLYYYALHFIQDSETCKDIVSDSFKLLWEKFDSIKKETILTYMFTLVRNSCIDHIRHTKVENSYLDFHINYIETDEADWKRTEKRIQQVMQIIETLNPQTKFIMEQKYIHKKKYKEIAEIVGLTESGVRKHIMKGLDTIRQFFSVKYKKGGNQNKTNTYTI